MTFDKETFDEWRDHPVTEEVMRALKVLYEQTKAEWIDHSWHGGNADPLMLADLRARAEAIDDLIELTYEELEKYLDDTSERDQPDRIQGADRAQAD